MQVRKHCCGWDGGRQWLMFAENRKGVAEGQCLIVVRRERESSAKGVAEAKAGREQRLSADRLVRHRVDGEMGERAVKSERWVSGEGGMISAELFQHRRGAEVGRFGTEDSGFLEEKAISSVLVRVQMELKAREQCHVQRCSWFTIQVAVLYVQVAQPQCL